MYTCVKHLARFSNKFLTVKYELTWRKWKFRKMKTYCFTSILLLRHSPERQNLRSLEYMKFLLYFEFNEKEHVFQHFMTIVNFVCSYPILRVRSHLTATMCILHDFVKRFYRYVWTVTLVSMQPIPDDIKWSLCCRSLKVTFAVCFEARLRLTILGSTTSSTTPV